jgi:hypothetical protein
MIMLTDYHRFTDFNKVVLGWLISWMVGALWSDRTEERLVTWEQHESGMCDIQALISSPE